MLKEAAERAESILDKDQVPEQARAGTAYTHVVSTKEGSYYFVIKRDQTGVWSLTGFEQTETPKPQQAIPC